MWIIEAVGSQARSDAGPICTACTGVCARDHPDPCVRYLRGLVMQRSTNSKELADMPHFSRRVSVRSQRLSGSCNMGEISYHSPAALACLLIGQLTPRKWLLPQLFPALWGCSHQLTHIRCFWEAATSQSEGSPLTRRHPTCGGTH